MRNVSRIIIALVVSSLLFLGSLLSNESFAAGIGISLDGNPIIFTQSTGSPFIDSANRTQVPLRITMEAAGCKVTWDDVNKTAIVEKNGITVKVPIRKTYILINDVFQATDTVALVYNGRTYLPIRPVLEAFGAKVEWNQSAGRVEVTNSVTVAIKTETINYQNGAIYSGDTLNGIPHGIGTLKYPNGDIYVGSWVNGLQDGQGVITFVSGDVVDGNFSNGILSGTGTITWTDGLSWTGQWKDNEPYIPAPTSVYATATSSGEISVGWTQATGADYYYVYYGSSSTGPWYAFDDSSGNKAPQNWTGTYSSFLYGNEPATKYYFKVTAVYDGMESKDSPIATATTLAEAAPITSPVTSSPSYTPSYSSGISGPLYLFSDDGKHVYLGLLSSSSYDLEGVFNPYGTYGSKYSLDSIWNQYGTYGSKYSSYSAFNEYSLSPPIIVDSKGNVIGRLTVNKYVTGAISPYTLKQLLISLGL